MSRAYILQTGPKSPFLPKLALIFYISGLENGIDLKFGPALGNDNLKLHAKFQVDPTTCCPESE